VSLDLDEPLLWDSERILLLIVGNEPIESIVRPRHRFEQRGSSDHRPAGLASGGGR